MAGDHHGGPPAASQRPQEPVAFHGEQRLGGCDPPQLALHNGRPAGYPAHLGVYLRHRFTHRSPRNRRSDQPEVPTRSGPAPTDAETPWLVTVTRLPPRCTLRRYWNPTPTMLAP